MEDRGASGQGSGRGGEVTGAMKAEQQLQATAAFWIEKLAAAKAEPTATLSAGKSSAGRSQGTGPIPIPNDITNPTTARIAQMAVHPCADVFAFGFQRPCLVCLVHGVHLCSDRHAR